MGQDCPESLDQGWPKPGPGRKIPVHFFIREKNVTSLNKQTNKQKKKIIIGIGVQNNIIIVKKSEQIRY